ncbi:hypothetical protein [Xanthomonas graminis]|uniref:Fungal lipase-like domain-containing protein n=1 Tax=Xanthomonas graminis pv. arrhenatheri LMG 727 TaxID=1195923 RepID=A0A0K2ZBL0_9XANT|nr:hypothetical protein [Xanthomonas translucens]UKE76619.1 hypothetical protein KM317_14230 [Xanthomonas translucens pv. arrhenatheri]CTP82231.1 hypothetical protein XTALMG727_0065 [Xanthomonas translucens pv. arrhenatheri LMG 727]
MKSIDQALADAANDSYANRPQRDVDTQKTVYFDSKKYQVFGYACDLANGFHATAYRSVAVPHNVIIAYRGTDPGLFSGETNTEKADHALTTLQDIAVDAKMVRDTVNTQKAAADAFTAQMIAKATAQGILKDYVFAASHSLGGAVAEIEAAKYSLRGATYNGFGAADLIDGPPQPGFHVTNYRMSGDVVSAASPHLGEVVSLASQDDLQKGAAFARATGRAADDLDESVASAAREAGAYGAPVIPPGAAGRGCGGVWSPVPWTRHTVAA